MKTFTKSIILCLAVLFCGSAYAETTKTTCFNKQKDPWRSLMSVMYSHGIDTTGLDVTSVMSLTDIALVNSDLAKAYRVSEPIFFTENTMLGLIITDYMKVKYKNKNGEKYDYYKNRFDPLFDMDSYNKFMSQYPRSRHADELKSKALCLDQNYSWYTNKTDEENHDTYRQYGVSQCPYPGFVSIANENNLYRKTLEDWDQLQMELSSTDRSDCQVYDDFMRIHSGHLGGVYWVVSDSIAQCQQRQQQNAWRDARKMHTVEGYRNYLLLYPDSKEANEAERRIEDITAWQQAVEGNSHESFGRYYSEYPLGDSVAVAGEKLRIMEEAAWQKAQKNNTIGSYESFLKQYPNGYYSGLALNRQLELEIKKFNSNKGGTVTKLELAGFSSQQGYSLLCFGNIGINDDITVSLLGSSPVKVVLKPGQSHWAKVKNGQYKIYVTSSNGSKWEEKGHGNLYVEDGLYDEMWYSYTYSTFIPTVTPTFDSKFIDRTAFNRISKEIDERIELEMKKLMKQDINSKRKVLRNVFRQFYEDNNNQQEYERMIRETEDDDNVNDTLEYLFETMIEK